MDGHPHVFPKVHFYFFFREDFLFAKEGAGDTKSGLERAVAGSAVIRNLRGVTPVALWKTLLK